MSDAFLGLDGRKEVFDLPSFLSFPLPVSQTLNQHGERVVWVRTLDCTSLRESNGEVTRLPPTRKRDPITLVTIFFPRYAVDSQKWLRSTTCALFVF